MTHDETIHSQRTLIRGLLLVLGLPQGVIGAWALFAPRSFYGKFPTGTGGWVHVLGAYDAHLVTDVGGLFIAFGVLMVLAAVSMKRSAVFGAAVAWTTFSTFHLIWHSFHLGPYGTADSIANIATLAWTVVGGLLILWLLRAPKATPAAERAPAGANAMRIAGVPDGKGGPVVRGTYAYSKKAVGVVADPTRVFAHHPGLLTGYGMLELATERADRVPASLKALAGTKAAALAGCEFCMDIASMISRETGVTERQLRELPGYRTSDAFDEVERLVLDFAVGMTRTPVDVSDELFARLAEHFDEAQLVELANEIAIENYRARFNWAFGIGSQDFTKGDFCVRPETLAEQAPAPA
jgi:alkylhydroperoxidase family enzyme